ALNLQFAFTSPLNRFVWIERDDLTRVKAGVGYRQKTGDPINHSKNLSSPEYGLNVQDSSFSCQQNLGQKDLIKAFEDNDHYYEHNETQRIGDIMNIAENLKKARKNKGLSQLDVAEKIRAGKTTYSAWENGTNPPPADKLALLAQVLDVSVHDLVFGEKEELDGSLRDLFRRFAELPEEIKPQATMMLRSLLFSFENVAAAA
ncbi:hypothetical protein AXE65_12400, partial [Ventosimonas gracilis]